MVNIFEFQSQAQAPMAIAHSYVFLGGIDHKTMTEGFYKTPGLVHCTGRSIPCVHMDSKKMVQLIFVATYQLSNQPNNVENSSILNIFGLVKIIC